MTQEIEDNYEKNKKQTINKRLTELINCEIKNRVENQNLTTIDHNIEWKAKQIAYQELIDMWALNTEFTLNSQQLDEYIENKEKIYIEETTNSELIELENNWIFIFYCHNMKICDDDGFTSLSLHGR